MVVDLSKFNNSWYNPQRGIIIQTIWYFLNAIFFQSPFFPFSFLKVVLLRLFGAQIGKKVIIKPSVNVKYPWFLEVGDYTWIGENVWIDNLAMVRIGSNVCISQGAMLLTGNHNYKRESFDLITGEVVIEDGCWIGAKCIACPGITCHNHAVLTVGSVATKDLEEYSVYKGNPAVKVKKRI